MASRQSKILTWVLGGTLGAALAITGTSLVAREDKNPSRLPLQDVQRFSTAISQIKSYYVKDVKDKELFEDAIRGMLQGLDPHSAYLDEQDFSDLTANTKGKFGGLGIEVTMEKGILKVISPIDDTPASRAGLKAGDYIIRIDDKPIRDMTLRDAVSLMRGDKGSTIKLLVLRKGSEKPLTFSIVRDIIQIKSVKSRLLEGEYGYIRISHFQAPTVKDMLKAIAQLQKESDGEIEGLILDLRNNPGGLLDSAIEMSDAFIHNDKQGKEELIVYTKGRLPGSEFRAVANPGDILKNAPIVVLINGGSASGSEIVAGALKDNKRAVIMGERSFGKGSVQTVLPLDDKRGIKLTTALYYTPSGTSIQAQGISPDIKVANVKIPKGESDPEQLAGLKEADLSGHLGNGNKNKDKTANKKAAEEANAKFEEQLMHEDYQLYEALNLIKGLTLLSKK